MMRRILVAGMAVALGAGGLVAGAATAAGASKPVVTAVGSVTCGAPGSGKAKISPPYLATTPQPGTRTVSSKFKSTCSGTTGNPLVTPTSAKISGVSMSSAATTCVDLLVGGETPTSTTVDIKWKASGGKINPTHIVFTSINGFSGPPSGFVLPGPTGVATVTGSYAGDTAVSTVLVADAQATLQAACLGKGLKKLNFSSGGSLVIHP